MQIVFENIYLVNVFNIEITCPNTYCKCPFSDIFAC